MGAYYPLSFNHYMTQLELYQEVGTWLNRYHDRKYRRTGLLKDFHHDLWLLLLEKQVTSLSFIKKYCYMYPNDAIRYKYYKKCKDFSSREVVLLDENLEPQTEFSDNSFNPEYEFPAPIKKRKKGHRDAKRVRVIYRNGAEEEFDSVVILAESIGVKRDSVQRVVGKPLSNRYTKRKMSHIKQIDYIDADQQPLRGQ